MTKNLCFLIFFMLIFANIPVSAQPSVSAEYACVIEAVTGEIVYAKNADVTHSMASTTKIMTALLAVESGKLDDVVTVSRKAASQEGSSIYLRPDDQIIMRDLVYGLMLNSGNDAAVAIAEHIAHDTESFAQMMTQRAQIIGAKNTAFKNPNGLDAPGHYTTAYDLALISREAMKNEEFAKIVATKTKKITLLNTNADIYLSNHNKMLKIYSGADGIKTGYTRATGRCLVSTAKRDGMRFIAVTLNAPSDWADHSLMLDYAFSAYETKNVLRKDDVLKYTKTGEKKEVYVCAGQDFDMPVKKEDDPSCEVVLHLPESLKIPINGGEKIGIADIVYAGNKIAQIDLISKYDVTENTKKMKKSLSSCFSKAIGGLFLY